MKPAFVHPKKKKEKIERKKKKDLGCNPSGILQNTHVQRHKDGIQ